MLSTGVFTIMLVTVVVACAVKPPSAVVTEIMLVPGETAVSNLFSSTVATLELAEFHVTFWFVALAGSTLAVSCCVEPTVMLGRAGGYRERTRT